MIHSNKISFGFTLIELMIVVAIIALLVALALPTYQNFTIRAKVSEGLSLASAAKVAIGTTCQEEPGITATNDSVGYAFTTSKYVNSIEVMNNCTEPWIFVKTSNTGAATDVWFSLDGYCSPDSGRVEWNCHQVRGEKRHLPFNCRGRHL